MGGTLEKKLHILNSATPLLKRPDATVSVTVDWHLKSSFLLQWCTTKKGGPLVLPLCSSQVPYLKVR